MNSVGNNYNQLVLEIQSNPNLDIVIGDFRFEMRAMKAVEGLFVQNTIVLEDEKDNRSIIIDDNTESIYVRYTDIDEKYNYILFGFKNPAHLKNILESEGYTINLLTDNEHYRNRLNQSLEVAFQSTETSFVIRKPILTTKEELLYAKSTKRACCDGLDTQEKSIGNDKDKRYDSIYASSTARSWNIVIYKRYSWINTSTILDALKSTLRSLSSRDGSDWFYSQQMYANLNVTYQTAPCHVYSPHARDCLDKFHSYLKSQSVPSKRSTHTYMYLADHTHAFNNETDGVGGLLDGYRIGVSNNLATVFAHEVGHTMGARHTISIVWDSSLGSFGWYAESIMHPITGGTSWYADQQCKYYQSTNRNTVRTTLD